MAPPKCFRFMNLPPETRDDVYTRLFAIGHVAIMRTAKEIKNESALAFRKAAASKIAVSDCNACDYDKTKLWVTSIFMLPSKFQLVPFFQIQNVEVHIDCGVKSCDRSNATTASLVDFARQTTRTTLMITLKNFNHKINAKTPHVALGWLSQITTFETVTVTAIAGGIMPRDSSQSTLSGSEHGKYGLHVRSRNRIMYDEVKGLLKPVLGPFTWHNAAVQGERYLEFHPRSHYIHRYSSYDAARAGRDVASESLS